LAQESFPDMPTDKKLAAKLTNNTDAPLAEIGRAGHKKHLS
jgi:hypothetical protein